MGRSSWVLGDMMPVLGLDHRSALIYLRLGEETRWSRDAQGEAMHAYPLVTLEGERSITWCKIKSASHFILIYLRLGEETRWSRDAQGEARKH
jgi:protein involved in temperature-dependent protein secretion